MAAAMGFGRFFFTPVLPAMMADLHLDASQTGLIASANFAGYLAGAVLAAYGWAAGLERRLALAALVANALLLAAMGLASTIPAFMIIRFLAGVTSALAMIFTSGIVLSHGLESRDGRVQILHFSGVGLGIALSALVVYAIPSLGWGNLAGWRIDWLTGAAFVAAAVAVVHVLLPRGEASRDAKPEPGLKWTPSLAALTLSYGLFGIGYVVTATFIVAIVRESGQGAFLECLTWLVTGFCAAASLAVWKSSEKRIGVLRSYRFALVFEAIGVAATVVLPPPLSALVGGFLFGATFMIVTAYGLQLGRIMAPSSQRRVLATMTAAFGIGQIIGPLLAGWMASATGSYGAPSLAAAVILAVSAWVTLAVKRC
ncbi:YbfB/YjiJ family MFS transporter [Sinorhizobium sp. BG8]|uniref:YbfB/YjiJ family MFS transporter n=1 Tax=Sinorhizobium sp. BG8 TaxID=2613773 RepID=UPI0032B187EF